MGQEQIYHGNPFSWSALMCLLSPVAWLKLEKINKRGTASSRGRVRIWPHARGIVTEINDALKRIRVEFWCPASDWWRRRWRWHWWRYGNSYSERASLLEVRVASGAVSPLPLICQSLRGLGPALPGSPRSLSLTLMRWQHSRSHSRLGGPSPESRDGLFHHGVLTRAVSVTFFKDVFSAAAKCQDCHGNNPSWRRLVNLCPPLGDKNVDLERAM